MYKYYQLNLFQVLIGSLTKSQTFKLDGPKLCLKRAE